MISVAMAGFSFGLFMGALFSRWWGAAPLATLVWFLVATFISLLGVGGSL